MGLELPKQWDGARLHVQETLNRHSLILLGDGNGTKGLLTQFQTFMADHAAREDEQEKVQKKRHAFNSTLLAVIAVLAAIGTGVITAIGIYIVHKDAAGVHSVLGSTQPQQNAQVSTSGKSY